MAEGGELGVPASLLAREAELMRMNEEIDQRRAAAAAAAAAVPLAGDVSDATGHDKDKGQELSVAASPTRSTGGRDSAPVSPAVRAAAASSAQRRSAEAAARPAQRSRLRQPRARAPGDSPAAPSPAASTAVAATPPPPATPSGSSVTQEPLRDEEGGRDARRAARSGSRRDSRGRSRGDDAAGSDDDGVPVSGMGAEAQLRYQKARMRVLRDERDAAIAARREMADSLRDALDKVKAGAEERRRLTKAAATADAEAEKQRKIAARANSKVSALHASLDSTKAELDAALREAKSRGTDTSARDVRLQRALEEIARLKEAAKRRDERRGEDEGARRKELDALRGEVRKLERQKQELLTAFRKQLRLIDVLKRQKVHMEAARMLAFTEEEFARALEAGV